MAIAEAYAGTQAVDTTEWSTTTDTAGPDVTTPDGVYQMFLDLSDMVTGDQLQIRLVEGVAGSSTVTTTTSIFYLYGPQPFPIWVSPTYVLVTGWDWTLKALAGTITVDWSIRAVT